MSDFKYQFFSWLPRKWFLIILKLVYTLLKLAESSQPFWKLTTIQTNVSFCLVPDTNYVCGVLCMCDKTRCGLVQHHQCDITTGYLTFLSDQMHTYLYRSLMQKQPMWAERHEAQEFEKLQLNGKQKVLVQSSHHASSMCGRQDSFSETFISGILLAIIGKGLEMP